MSRMICDMGKKADIAEEKEQCTNYYSICKHSRDEQRTDHDGADEVVDESHDGRRGKESRDCRGDRAVHERQGRGEPRGDMCGHHRGRHQARYRQTETRRAGRHTPLSRQAEKDSTFKRGHRRPKGMVTVNSPSIAMDHAVHDEPQDQLRSTGSESDEAKR